MRTVKLKLSWRNGEREKKAAVEELCNGHSDGADFVYELTDHSHIPMTVTQFLTYSFIYICMYVQYIYIYISYTKSEMIMHLKMHSEWCFERLALRNDCVILRKYDLFKVLYLTIKTGYHIFDIFAIKIKYKNFTWRVNPGFRWKFIFPKINPYLT